MRFATFCVIALLALSGLSQIQEPPVVVVPSPTAVPVPAAVPAPVPAPPAPSPILENTGKPIGVPFECTADDIQLAGLTCTGDDPCPVYLELTAVEAVSNRIFLAGNLHSPAVTMFSALLGSEDGGRTWREVHERIRSAGLDHIQFLDAETGWVAGETLSPLPEDPFLLRTTDGGKTWRQRFIFSETAEDHLGIIQQFFFAARDSGSLIVDRGQGSDIDRYELHESRDAGETWAFQKSSKQPLRLRQAPAEPAEWRLRVDRPTRSFQVEHRQASGWVAVASFLVSAGVCKP